MTQTEHSLPGIDDWERSVDRFIEYLPKSVDRWVIWAEPVHEKIVRSLDSRLRISHRFILGEANPADVAACAREYRDRDDVGLVSFTVRDARAQQRHDGYAEALQHFTFWPPSRVRLCLDVWDANFAALFAEDPRALADRCGRMYEALRPEPRLHYERIPGGPRLDFDCTGSEWTSYDGIEERSDYILPIGEVASLPDSVDGVLDIDGWLIGTIPFGLKYGRITPGDLVIHFEGGRISRVTGANTALCDDLRAALDAVPGLNLVGELGIGQSLAATQAARTHRVGCRWHERSFGVHIGLGAELPEAADPEHRSTTHHLDIVLAAGRLTGTVPLLEW